RRHTFRSVIVIEQRTRSTEVAMLAEHRQHRRAGSVMNDSIRDEFDPVAGQLGPPADVNVFAVAGALTKPAYRVERRSLEAETASSGKGEETEPVFETLRLEGRTDTGHPRR